VIEIEIAIVVGFLTVGCMVRWAIEDAAAKICSRLVEVKGRLDDLAFNTRRGS
jgi:hypothetical protein